MGSKPLPLKSSREIKERNMPLFVVFIVVLAGGSIGYALGLIKRMRDNPELQGKGLKILFQKDDGQSE
ncbi:hypothetical protein [Corynebacterium parakroppenstedtii]|nr:hypothetical protein [Corynebacterium parakroppenstedtii]